MKIKYGLAVTLSLVMLGSARPVNAENSDIGAALVKVCTDGAGKIISARMLDFQEGLDPRPFGYGYQISEAGDASAPQGVKDQLQNALIEGALQKLDGLPLTQKLVTENANEARKNQLIVDRNVLMPEKTGRLHESDYSEKCENLAAGGYERDGFFHIRSDIYSAMDSVNQAALFIHAGVLISLYDKANARDSENSRKVTAQFFAADVHKIGRELTGLEIMLSPVESQNPLNYYTELTFGWNFKSNKQKDAHLIEDVYLPMFGGVLERYEYGNGIDYHVDYGELSEITKYAYLDYVEGKGHRPYIGRPKRYTARLHCNFIKMECVVFKTASGLLSSTYGDPLDSEHSRAKLWFTRLTWDPIRHAIIASDDQNSGKDWGQASFGSRCDPDWWCTNNWPHDSNWPKELIGFEGSQVYSGNVNDLGKLH